MWWWRSGISGETEACVRAFAQKAPSAEWQATTPALFHQNLTVMRGIETVTSRGQKGGDRKMRERKRGFLSTFMPKCYSRTSQLYLFGAILLCPCGGCRVQPCEMDQPLQDSRMAPDAMSMIHTLSPSPGAAPQTRGCRKCYSAPKPEQGYNTTHFDQQEL